MSEIPHLAIPGEGNQTLDERRVERVRTALADVDRLAGPAYGLVADLDAVLASRALLPVLPSWARLVAQQPCIDDLDDARRALDDELGADADPAWRLVEDELLCERCVEDRARPAAAGEV